MHKVFVFFFVFLGVHDRTSTNPCHSSATNGHLFELSEPAARLSATLQNALDETASPCKTGVCLWSLVALVVIFMYVRYVKEAEANLHLVRGRRERVLGGRKRELDWIFRNSPPGAHWIFRNSPLGGTAYNTDRPWARQ